MHWEGERGSFGGTQVCGMATMFECPTGNSAHRTDALRRSQHGGVEISIEIVIEFADDG